MSDEFYHIIRCLLSFLCFVIVVLCSLGLLGLGIAYWKISIPILISLILLYFVIRE